MDLRSLERSRRGLAADTFVPSRECGARHAEHSCELVYARRSLVGVAPLQVPPHGIAQRSLFSCGHAKELSGKSTKCNYLCRLSILIILHTVARPTNSQKGSTLVSAMQLSFTSSSASSHPFSINAAAQSIPTRPVIDPTLTPNVLKQKVLATASYRATLYWLEHPTAGTANATSDLPVTPTDRPMVSRAIVTGSSTDAHTNRFTAEVNANNVYEQPVTNDALRNVEATNIVQQWTDGGGVTSNSRTSTQSNTRTRLRTRTTSTAIATAHSQTPANCRYHRRQTVRECSRIPRNRRPAAD